MAQVRPYRGIEAPERLAQRRRKFLDAGLDLLGGENDPGDLTVRAICRQAGLGVRYFYEGFTDKDEFVAAVFDWVIADIAATTQAAVAAVPLAEQTRAGMANIVRTIAGDPRIGRLLFGAQLSNEVVSRKRTESIGFFAELFGQHAGHALQVRRDSSTKAVAHFAVGGVTHTIGAWLAGEVEFGPDELVDQLGRLLDGLAKTALRGPIDGDEG